LFKINFFGAYLSTRTLVDLAPNASEGAVEISPARGSAEDARAGGRARGNVLDAVVAASHLVATDAGEAVERGRWWALFPFHHRAVFALKETRAPSFQIISATIETIKDSIYISF